MATKTKEQLEKEQKDELNKLTPEMIKLVESQQKQNENFQKSMKETMDSFQQSMNSAMTTMADTLKDSQQSKSQEDKNPVDDNVDLESLSRADFMNHIVDKISGAVEGKLKGVTDKLDLVQDNTTKNAVKQAVEAFKAKTPDFMEWKDELRDKIKGNPNLTIEDAYKLVRVDNPEKAKEMDDKFKSDDTSATEDTEGKKKAKFGGLVPSETGDTEEPNKNMSQDDAAEAAWEETFGELDDISSVAGG